MDTSIGAPEVLILFAVLVYASVLIDIWRSSSKDHFEKIFWTCIVIFFHLIGIVVYVSVGRKEKFIYDVIRKFKSAN